jgi:hypothetical protein
MAFLANLRRLPIAPISGLLCRTCSLEGGFLASERVERKLTAILAADVAGYSRLMGADDEGTLAQLKACRRELCHFPPFLGLTTGPCLSQLKQTGRDGSIRTE